MRASRHPARVLAGLFAVVALGAAACGDDATRPAAGAKTEKCPSPASLGLNADLLQDHGAEPASGSDLSITAGDLYFEPTCVTDITGGAVTLTIHNSGQSLHNISVPDQGIDTDIAAGETVTVTVDIGAEPVSYFCKYHQVGGMEGALVPTGA